MSTFTPSAATTRLLTDKFSGTGNPLVNWSAVWNNAATTFTGIQFDVTDTASAAGSLLMDLRVGGNTVASINKSGFFVSPGGGLIVGGTNSQYTYQASALALLPSGQAKVLIQTNEFNISNLPISWTSNTTAQAVDLSIWRDAADTLAQRNGVNAQAFRIYNTFTDASNYERLLVRWSSNLAALFTDAAGSGTARGLQVGTLGLAPLTLVTNGNTRVTVDSSGGVGIGTTPATATLSVAVNLRVVNSGYNGMGIEVNTLNGIVGAHIFNFNLSRAIISVAESAPAGSLIIQTDGASRFGSYMQLSEMTAPAAPAANNVVIYAEDNGSGKTRLMARFATGAAQQIAIEP